MKKRLTSSSGATRGEKKTWHFNSLLDQQNQYMYFWLQRLCIYGLSVTRILLTDHEDPCVIDEFGK